jgi:hypothetical protein
MLALVPKYGLSPSQPFGPSDSYLAHARHELSTPKGEDIAHARCVVLIELLAFGIHAEKDLTILSRVCLS